MSNFIIRKERLIHKGAEASLILGEWMGHKVIFKERFPKKYRIEQIDRELRRSRTLNEARALIKVKKYGVNVPQVFEIDIDSSTIIMNYIRGTKLKDLIHVSEESKLKLYFTSIGKFVARLHLNGHIHGDITTSNVIITPENEVFLIDFGLHEYSDSIEDKSVDLHLLKTVLISSHGDHFKICFQSFLNGYRLEYHLYDSDEHIQVINNIKAIETRGRYVKQEERKY